MKTKNRILAIPAVAAEMPVNPNSPAISETTRKNNANLSTTVSFPVPRKNGGTAGKLPRCLAGIVRRRLWCRKRGRSTFPPMRSSDTDRPGVQLRVSGEGWLTYAVGCGLAALPPVSCRDLDSAWNAARHAALSGEWGAVRGFRFAEADGEPVDIALADRDACCWAGAVDSRVGLQSRYGISVLLRLLALVNLIASASWSHPLCQFSRDGADLDPSLLAAAATEPLNGAGQFDEAAFRARLSRALLSHTPPPTGPMTGATA